MVDVVAVYMHAISDASSYICSICETMQYRNLFLVSLILLFDIASITAGK